MQFTNLGEKLILDDDASIASPSCCISFYTCIIYHVFKENNHFKTVNQAVSANQSYTRISIQMMLLGNWNTVASCGCFSFLLGLL